MKPDTTLPRARGKAPRQTRRRMTGLVEVAGPLSRGIAAEIRNLTRNVLDRERERDPDARLLSISLFAEGLAIETSSARLAQDIAGAIRRSHKADVERVEDEGGRRILTCRLRTMD